MTWITSLLYQASIKMKTMLGLHHYFLLLSLLVLLPLFYVRAYIYDEH